VQCDFRRSSARGSRCRGLACDHVYVALDRPERISDQHWESIQAHEARLARACESDDMSWVVGASKEFCESVAAVVCAELAQPVGTGDDFGKLLTSAHEALDRRPGRGAATERAIRGIAQGARSIVDHVNTMRNEVGTGHGRPLEPIVTREMATISAGAARLWADWALARLDEVLRGEVAGLIHELQTRTFRKGTLAQRFVEVGLRSLHSDDQRRIGVAVARRASGGGTFVVAIDGIDPLRSDAAAWPASYRRGVAAGLLLDSGGRFALRMNHVEDLAAIVAVMDTDEWKELAAQAVEAQLAEEVASDPAVRTGLAERLSDLAATLDPGRRDPWQRIADSIGGSVGSE
jgi:hypothetical protein